MNRVVTPTYANAYIYVLYPPKHVRLELDEVNINKDIIEKFNDAQRMICVELFP